MTLPFEYSTLSNLEEFQQLGVMLSQCFNSPPDSIETYSNRIGLDNFRIIRTEGKIAGGLAIYHMGQWFGGQCVPMGGIAAVCIAPEYRGSGAALTLMQKVVRELYDNGIPISALYPATQRLYRKVGYEQGGTLCTWEAPTQSIQIKERSLPIQPVVPLNIDVFRELYQQQAKQTNGNLDRNQAIWQGVTTPDEQEAVYAYLFGSTPQPEGYIIFSQHQKEDGSIVRVKDWAALTPAAVKSFWTFIAAHRSQIDKVRWRSALTDALTLLLPEQTAKIRSSERWMLRIIDVTRALEKRGYPQGIETELHLDIQDELLPENNGKFILAVSNGRGEVTPGGKGELQLNVRGLSSLYTGLFTPYQLQLAGKLQGTESALLTATQLFSGSSPWMPDFF